MLPAIAIAFAAAGAANVEPAQVIHFDSGDLHLAGELFKPPGDGPFPAILWNHGSACCMWSSEASALIGPMFARAGWAFFMPYRRGQGTSASAGAYVGDEIARAGRRDADATATRLLTQEHLQDQLAGLRWLRTQPWVQPTRVAVGGNSFGGIETVFGAAAADPPYCAAVDASGGAESWSRAPLLQDAMKAAVRGSRSPIFFFQAENDHDLTPTRVLADEARRAGVETLSKFYPAFGTSTREGHSFAYAGASIWFDDAFAFVRAHCASRPGR